MNLKLELERAAEKKLDRELEAILGRAITMDDLEALYQQDLKLLGQLEAGLDNKIGSMREIIMARYVQKAWRGYMARKRVKKLRKSRKDFMEQYGVFTQKNEKLRKERAVAVISRRWKQYAFRKQKNIEERVKSIKAAAQEQENLEDILSKE